MQYIAFFTLLLSAFFTACTKHAGDIDSQPPTAVITFNSPTQNGNYNTSDSVLIQGMVIATTTMHGYDLMIKNDTDTLFTAQIHDHNDTMHINKMWKTERTGTFEAKVTVHLDHDGHTATKGVSFFVK